MIDFEGALLLTNSSGILCEPEFDDGETVFYPCGMVISEGPFLALDLEASEIRVIKGAHVLAHYLDGLGSDGANGLRHDYKSAGKPWTMHLMSVTCDAGETYEIIGAEPRMVDPPLAAW
jgi:hypothetical protein